MPEVETEYQKRVILYVGRVSLEKNLGLVVESCKQMDHNKCHLMIVGHGPASDEIQSDCNRTQTPVTFGGYLQGVDLATAYASADIFAFPSFTETFGQLVLEVMASGLPVVGLLAEGLKDLVKHQETGYLLDVRDMSRKTQVEKYRAYIEQLIDKPEITDAMSAVAIADCKQYTWWEAMESIVEVYRDAVMDMNQEVCE